MTLQAVYIGDEQIYNWLRNFRPNWDWQVPVTSIDQFTEYANNGTISSDTAIIMFDSRLYSNPLRIYNNPNASPQQHDKANTDIDNFLSWVYNATQSALTIIINYSNDEANINDELQAYSGQIGGTLKSYWWIEPKKPNLYLDTAIKEYINSPESDPDTVNIIAGSEGLHVPANEDNGGALGSIKETISNVVSGSGDMDTGPKYTNNYNTRGLLICNTSNKGGAGKTTTALGEAVWIAKSSEKAAQAGLIPHPLKVCVVDLDVHDSQIGTVIGKSSPTILNLALANSIDQKSVADTIIYSDRLNCSFLLSPKLPTTSDSIPITKFQEAIEVLQTMFDIVILDTSVGYTEALFAKVAYPMADKIVLVTTLDRRSIIGMGKWIIFVGGPTSQQGAGIDLNKVYIIINRGMKDVSMSLKDVQSMINMAVQKVYQETDKTIPPEQWHKPRLISVIPDIPNGILMRVSNEQRFDLAMKLDTFESSIMDACKAILPKAFREPLRSLNQ